MRDAFILLMLLFLFGAACKRPFLMTLGYLYVDLFQPQQVSYYLVNTVPVSMIFGACAVGFYIVFDNKEGVRFGRLQFFMLLFLLWVTFTTFNAQVADAAWEKWDPAWKSIVFGVFLPTVLTTRQRLEAAIIFMILCVGAITITGGIKTILGGGGYGSMNLLVESNTGLYESSTIAAVSIALIPLIVYSYQHNQIIPKSRITLLITAGLVFAAALIPIGTEARTGLLCLALLGFLTLMRVKHKMRYIGAMTVVLLIAIPLLPESYTGRMNTIKTYDEDNSASTRVAVWSWTWEFVKSHPFGGGFYAYRLNEIEVEVRERVGEGRQMREVVHRVKDRARAFHSSYFEVLGEHGYPGIIIYIGMMVAALIQQRGLVKRYRHNPQHIWVADLARALSHTFLVYMVGSLFVGIAFQSTLYFLLAFTASLGQVAAVRASTAESQDAIAMAKPGGVRPRFAAR